MLATSILAPEKLAEITDDILRRLEAIRKDVQRHFEPWEDREAEDLLRGAILIYLNKFPNIEHSIQAHLGCRLAWQKHSLALWDNRVCLHHAVSDYFGERLAALDLQ